MIRTKIRDNWGIMFSGVFVLLCGIFVIINGDNIIIPVHDNLDAPIAWLKMLSDHKLFFNYTAEVPFLGGIDRNYLYSNLKIQTWVYMILPTYVAYISTYFIRVIISILGSIYLGKILCADDRYCNVTCILGLIYGILPFYPAGALGAAYIPFLLGFIILYSRTGQSKYVIGVAVYALFSDFVFFGIFVCGYLLLYFILNWIVTKRINLRIIFMVVVLAISYIITEWRLFYVLFFSGEETIRASFVDSVYDIRQTIIQVIKIFCSGHYHAHSLHTWIVLPVCLIYFCFLNSKYIHQKMWQQMLQDWYNRLIALIIFNSIVYGLNYCRPFKSMINTLFPFLKGFNFSRTNMFNPFLWYLAFGVVLFHLITGANVLKKIIAYGLLLSAFLIVCISPSQYNHIQQNLDAIKLHAYGRSTDFLTYREFYSEDLFKKIKEDIEYDGEWAVAFGMHPSVLQYNGIATLDGYISYYPLKYKIQFRQLIAPELQIDETNRRYFDDHGIRAYIYSDEIGYQPVRTLERDSAHMRIDADKFREMNGKYIFSRVALLNAQELEIKLIGKYQTEDSPYTIYVYQTKV